MGGTLTKLFGKKEVRVLMQGLDAAGKTTTLYYLKLGEVVTTIPTIGFNVETIEHKNINITAWDVGGREKIRPLWRHYYTNTDGIVYIVDSNDRDRISDAKDELQRLLAEDELRECPVLVIANKQDLPNAMSAMEVSEKMELNSFRNKLWMIVPAVATQGEGLHDGLDWLARQMATKQAKKSLSTPVSETVQGVKDMVSSHTASDYVGKTIKLIKSWFSS